MGTEVDRKKILSFWEKPPHFFHEEAAFPPGSPEYSDKAGLIRSRCWN